MAADRGGATASAVSAAVSAAALKGALGPVVETDIVLVSDGAASSPPCAAALGVRREAFNLAAGERVRDAFHIQTVNSRHGQLKGFLRDFRGVATKYLDSYLRGFHLIGLAEPAFLRGFLGATMNSQSIRFAN